MALRNEFGKFAEGENAFVDCAFVVPREGNLEPDSYGLRVLKTTEGGTQVILVHLKEEIEPTPKSLSESRGAPLQRTKTTSKTCGFKSCKYPHRINREALHSLAGNEAPFVCGGRDPVGRMGAS